MDIIKTTNSDKELNEINEILKNHSRMRLHEILQTCFVSNNELINIDYLKQFISGNNFCALVMNIGGIGYQFNGESFQDIFEMVKNMHYTKETMNRINYGLDSQYSDIHNKIDSYLKDGKIKQMNISDLEHALGIKIS